MLVELGAARKGGKLIWISIIYNAKNFVKLFLSVCAAKESSTFAHFRCKTLEDCQGILILLELSCRLLGIWSCTALHALLTIHIIYQSIAMTLSKFVNLTALPHSLRIIAFR